MMALVSQKERPKIKTKMECKYVSNNCLFISKQMERSEQRFQQKSKIVDVTV